jgi:hypothetical protein
MQPTAEEFSKRAGILKKVLDWVNQKRFEDHDSWMIFGNRGVMKVTVDTDPETEELYERNKPEHEQAYQVLGDLQVYGGKLLDARRTSLNPQPPKAIVRGLEDSADMEPGLDWRAVEEPSPTEKAEDLDAFYAAQLIGKLDKVVERATSLDPHKVDASQIHDSNIRAYFEEAHRCYLYGFNAACAVMCRAILESAIKSKVDPDHRIEMYLPKGQSLFRVLLEKSRLEKALKDGAEQVKMGGDFAIHNFKRFQKEYQSQGLVEVGLAVTRDVLANLYPQPTDAEI